MTDNPDNIPTDTETGDDAGGWIYKLHPLITPGPWLDNFREDVQRARQNQQAARDLYEYVYTGNETRTVHIWLTPNELNVANWVLNEDAGIGARVKPCPDGCDYRKLPTPWEPS